jgi:FtsH-binding integral membrane protein
MEGIVKMLVVSAILFAVAALGGLVLGVSGLRQRDLPVWLSVIHGLAAAAGLITLILGVVQGNAGSLLFTSLVLFIIAALGGFLLLSYHIRKKPHPKGLIVIHALVAVVAFVLLLIDIL